MTVSFQVSEQVVRCHRIVFAGYDEPGTDQPVIGLNDKSEVTITNNHFGQDSIIADIGRSPAMRALLEFARKPESRKQSSRPAENNIGQIGHLRVLISGNVVKVTGLGVQDLEGAEEQWISWPAPISAWTVAQRVRFPAPEATPSSQPPNPIRLIDGAAAQNRGTTGLVAD